MIGRVALATLLLTLVSVAAADEPVLLRPSDFAYGIPIQVTGAGPLFELALPRAVYETVTRTDLGDLRVFNAHGEVVPSALRPPEAAPAPAVWMRLALFPVHGGGRKADELVLRVRKNRSGAIVSVQPGPGAGSGPPTTFYLVDASADDRPMRALELDWKDPSAAGFSGDLRVEASDDLKQWRVLADAAPLARLHYRGQLLERRRIEFAPQRAKYLRLVWQAPVRAVALTEIRAERLTEVLPARDWIALAPAGRGAKPGEFLYTLAGRMPADRVRIRLPQVDTLAGAELYSRADRADGWQLRASGPVYRLDRNGQELIGDALAFSPDADGDREWLLRLAAPDAVPGNEAPALELGWVPQQLLFAARGDGPFLLAYGSDGMLPGGDSQEKLLQEYSGRGAGESVLQPATPGAQLVLGGSKRLQVPFTALPWRKWLLWSAIALGVFMVGLLVGRRYSR